MHCYQDAPVAMPRHAPVWSVRVAQVGVETSGSRVADAILRSVIWGFVGALFGVLFVPLLYVVVQWFADLRGDRSTPPPE